MNNHINSSILWKNPVSMWVLFGLIALLLGYASLSTIQDMIHVWNTSEEYGYAYLIPIISLFLIWQRKNQLAEVEFSPSIYGLILTMIGGLVFLAGIIAASRTIPQYGMVITILGVAWALLGWKAFRLILAPLAILFLMVPLPLFIYQALSGKLQLISSYIGVEVIRWFGISVYLEGNVIDLGSYKLQVVEACSGLRYLFPLVSLSFLAAYIFQAEFWKRAVVFISSVPITVLMNSFRIGVIGVLVEYGGPGQAEGFLHDFEGWVVFMGCIFILVILMAILVRIGPRKQTLREAFAIDLPEPIPESIQRQKRIIKPISWFVPILILGIAIANVHFQDQEKIVPERRAFAEFPLSIAGWEGMSVRLDENVLRSLKTDDYIVSNFVNADKKQVNFYAAYYANQVSGGSIHSPRGCIPGGGWVIKDLTERNIEGVEYNGQPIKVNRLLITRGDYNQVVYYWFQERGRNITSEWMAKWYLFLDSLSRSRSDGALVRITTSVLPGEDIASADARSVDFLKLVSPFLSEYIPD